MVAKFNELTKCADSYTNEQIRAVIEILNANGDEK